MTFSIQLIQVRICELYTKDFLIHYDYCYLTFLQTKQSVKAHVMKFVAVVQIRLMTFIHSVGNLIFEEIGNQYFFSHTKKIIERIYGIFLDL